VHTAGSKDISCDEEKVVELVEEGLLFYIIVFSFISTRLETT